MAGSGFGLLKISHPCGVHIPPDFWSTVNDFQFSKMPSNQTNAPHVAADDILVKVTLQCAAEHSEHCD